MKKQPEKNCSTCAHFRWKKQPGSWAYCEKKKAQIEGAPGKTECGEWK